MLVGQLNDRAGDDVVVIGHSRSLSRLLPVEGLKRRGKIVHAAEIGFLRG